MGMKQIMALGELYFDGMTWTVVVASSGMLSAQEIVS